MKDSLRRIYLRDCEGAGRGRRNGKRCGALLALLRDWRLLLLRLKGG